MGSDDKERPLERFAHILIGFVIWGWLMYHDTKNGTNLSELSSGDMIVKAIQYGFAAILIKGASISELVELIKAWRGQK